MKTWSFYDSTTGLFIGRRFSGMDSHLSANTPSGFVAIEGSHDRLSTRVDLTTGEVVEYQPPQPNDDHEWNGATKRWQLTAAAKAANAADSRARAELDQLDHRAIRYLVDSIAGTIDDEGKRRLTMIQSRKAELRQMLKPNANTSAAQS